MHGPFSILALDFHNTIYDEVMEYGLAIEEAVRVWLEVAKEQGRALSRETLYSELASAHRALGSDWDDEVWRHLSSLKQLGLSDEAFTKALNRAETQRRNKSRQLTLSGFYEGVYDTLTTLKERGIPIYIITEAAADVGMQAVQWLGLGGIVNGVYSYPSRKAPAAIIGTYHKPFSGISETKHYKKPHPFLLANVILDETIRQGKIPAGITLEDVFMTEQDKVLTLPELPQDTPIQNDISARLTIRDTPYAQALKQTRDALLFVGDSKFKDGLLARNAGVAFGYAAYGKKIKEGEEENQHKSLEIMYAVTGWEPDVLKLTQEAGRSQSVTQLKPDFVFENSLAEAMDLFIR